MDIKIEGNPGTGNTFQQINIQHVEHYNTQPVTINNYYGSRASVQDTAGKPGLVDTALIRKEILEFVSRVRPLLKDEWKARYMQMWDDILSLEAVETVAYNPGKQKNTNFNRKLIAGILHLLDSYKIYRNPYNATAITKALGYGWEHPVRCELAVDPADKEIVNAINNLLDTKNYN